jgi:hypothetical protein
MFMSRSRARRAFTLVETLVALTAGLALLSGLLSIGSLSGRGTRAVVAGAQAVTSAERAAARISADLATMLPPDPAKPERLPRITEGGKRLEFHRLEPLRDALEARPVVYELVRDAQGGAARLHRDGRPLPGVTLETFSAGRTIERGEGGRARNPTLVIVIVGCGREGERSETHRLRLAVRIPEGSPAAIRDLPAPGRALIDEFLTYR